MVTMRSQDYGSKNPITGKEVENSSFAPATSPLVSDPLHIEKLNPNLLIKPPDKGTS